MSFWENVNKLNLDEFRLGIRSIAKLGEGLVMACLEIGPNNEGTGHQHPFDQ